jgi:hypothetical protein
MKTTVLRIGVFLLFFSLIGAGCEKEEDGYSNFIEGSIVGTFICDEVDAKTGEASGAKTQRGYCILIEGSEISDSPYPMDFYTFDLSNDLFAFPNEILSPNFNGGNCGPNFFPDSFKNAYEIKFKYQILNDDDESQFVCGDCAAMELGFPWEDFAQISIKDVTEAN